MTTTSGRNVRQSRDYASLGAVLLLRRAVITWAGGGGMCEHALACTSTRARPHTHTHTHTATAREAVTLNYRPPYSPLPLTLSGIFPAWFQQVLQTAPATMSCLPGHCVGSGIAIATWPLWAGSCL